jgi:hypothetical protein
LHCIFYITISCACSAYLLWNQFFFYPYLVSLVVLRNFCRYFIRMTEKACRAMAFLSWYSQTSLPEDRFALTLHAWTKLFFCVACFCCFSIFIFNQKKMGGFDARFLLKFSAISCIFIYFDSSLCFDKIYIHMVKIPSLICAEFSCCIFTR